MSSSRSIAAARNRRVNEAPKKVDPPKPPQQSQQQVPFSRITVSDAIGLITIRLGRVEQLLQKTDLSTKSLELPPNSQIVDNSVFQTILSRLDVLEKRDADMKKELIGEMTTLVSEFRYIVDTRFQEIDDAFVELENHLVIEDKELEKDKEKEDEEKTDIELLVEEENE